MYPIENIDIRTYGWMISRLNLERKELPAFSVIYSCHENKMPFRHEWMPYLSAILDCKNRSTKLWLTRLEKKGLIVNDGQTYSVNLNAINTKRAEINSPETR